MKNTIRYIYITFFTLLLFGVVSCELDEYNPSNATAEEVWNSTPENFQTLVNSAYDKQRYWYNKEDGIFLAEMGTDLWFNRDKRLWAGEITQYVNFHTNVGFVRNAWRELYIGVNQSNAGINRIDNIDWPSDEERNSSLAELRFMRAFYYWHIVEQWGGAILRTQETQEAIQTSERSSVEDFYELILSDLQFAAEHLPIDQGEQYSRADKKAAYGFLARAALSRAYYGDEATYFEMARDAAMEVINRKEEFGVELWENYGDLWDPENNKNNKEALYVISNSDNPSLNFDTRGNKLHQFFLSPYSGKPGLEQSLEYGRDNGRQFMPTLALLDFYDEEIDERYYGSFKEAWIANTEFTWDDEDVEVYDKEPEIEGVTMTPGADTALFITKKRIANESERPYVVIDRDSVYNPDGTIKTGNDYVVLKKYMDPFRESAGAEAGYLDIIVMRLAEMYLIAAEAEHQLGNNAAAAEHINVLRTRAAAEGSVEEMQISPSDVDINFILDERARELAGEFLRWFDLKRTGRLEERIEEYNPDITEFQPYHALRPIPQGEIDQATNDLQQNPGY
ncbi:RagB/SusD family nutrient uptake outer membrane protein [Autumnicola musiva]|uniref:RagB/SusD family nutrient uptake outer membrane protein n=1 Tax=Autumnicola musiva TaxID=3075589 RepID=A0ABU3D7S0_9FLAO|nr:RagB/SusD family nutrient uptake outer membrane protein [Zunongwangia sp. F117]MDT0677573.1 RagB/SusD family nutrient uptake outer membrane protein [Zunongwangia sp. F117]